MLAMIELDFNADDKIKALPPDIYAQLREAVPQLKLPEDQGTVRWLTRDFLADLTTDGPALGVAGIKFTVSRFKSTYRATVKDAAGGDVTINVAIPNLGLLAVTEVMVLDDVCTNILQAHLDEGWRILAVCPPAAQRRPDYILGRCPDWRKDR